jgi:hypothetical protein
MGRGGPPIDHMLDEIGASDAEKTRIEAALDKVRAAHEDDRPTKEEHEKFAAEMHAKELAFMKAFASDDFDASKSLPEPPDHARMHGGPDGFLEMLSVAVPLMEPATREKLAQKTESGPEMGPRGDRGPRQNQR